MPWISKHIFKKYRITISMNYPSPFVHAKCTLSTEYQTDSKCNIHPFCRKMNVNKLNAADCRCESAAHGCHSQTPRITCELVTFTNGRYIRANDMHKWWFIKLKNKYTIQRLLCGRGRNLKTMISMPPETRPTTMFNIFYFIFFSFDQRPTIHRRKWTQKKNGVCICGSVMPMFCA